MNPEKARQKTNIIKLNQPEYCSDSFSGSCSEFSTNKRGTVLYFHHTSRTYCRTVVLLMADARWFETLALLFLFLL